MFLIPAEAVREVAMRALRRDIVYALRQMRQCPSSRLLGADRTSVISMVLRGAFLQIVIGLLIGIPACARLEHFNFYCRLSMESLNHALALSAVM